jgi:SAM-dependent methyltransferase
LSQSFYDGTTMGAGFEANPVIAVQREQLRALARQQKHLWRVLDLGCGAGTPTQALMSDTAKYRVVGADLSAAALREYVAATGRSAVRVDAEHLPFADGSFEAVVSDDVIEHLVDTDAYAREIRRVLAPGGYLMLSTPNLAAWFNRLGLLGGLQPAFTEVSFERIFGRPGSDIVGHLRLFTARSIREFLQHHGFELIDVRGARFDAMPDRVRRLDTLLARFPSVAGISVVVAQKPADEADWAADGRA